MSAEVPKRLRVAYLSITPVLMWDDGDELSPGPPAGAVALPLSAVPDFLDRLPGELLEAEKNAASLTTERHAHV